MIKLDDAIPWMLAKHLVYKHKDGVKQLLNDLPYLREAVKQLRDEHPDELYDRKLSISMQGKLVAAAHTIACSSVPFQRCCWS